MDIALLTTEDYRLYNRFIDTHPQGSLFQSLEWQRYQEKAFGLNSFIVIAKENNHIMASALVFRYPLPFGKSYFYTPRGPLFSSNPATNEALLQYIQKQGKQHAIFLKIDPFITQKDIPLDILLSHSKKQPSTSHQPKTTLLLDLLPDEESILKQMKEKGRYNIRLSAKKGVQVSQGTIDDIYPLLYDTAQRDGFHIHQKKVYETMVQELSSHTIVLTASFEGKIIAGGIFVLYKNMMIYYYGASSNEYRNVMAPYLIQWEAIKYGKEHGATTYDFLGIADKDVKNHPWASVTEFKLKFGGTPQEYIGAFDIPYSSFWYKLYRFYKRLR